MDKIDFVITWVDGNDPEWIKEKEKYSETKLQDAGNGRYRDLNLLKYWFRSVEKNANWVNKVYLVTAGHYPKWLNLDNDKLVLVKHSDYIPEKYLPVFSSHPIELNLHRIKGLSEKFVYFNDDMFVTKKVLPTDFFVNDLPLDIFAQNAYSFDDIDRKVTDLVLINDMYVINRNFNKKSVIKKNFAKCFSVGYRKFLVTNILLSPWPHFTGIKPMHVPASFLKETFSEVWRTEQQLLDTTCSHRFRDISDVNPWLIQFWQMAKGKYMPRKVKDIHYFPLSTNDEENKALYDAIKKQQYKLICINDGNSEESYDIVRDRLIHTFETIYPDRSSFERIETIS